MFGTVSKKGYREYLLQGRELHLAVLPTNSMSGFPWSIVLLDQVETVPIASLWEAATSAPHTRYALRSPYREALADAFTRSLGRVALEVTYTEFEEEGEAAAQAVKARHPDIQ